MITKETILALIQILQSMSGIILGIAFAVFTLAYAFIQNKKESLKEIEELIKNEGISTTLLRKRNSSTKFILKFKWINKDAVILIFISLIGLMIGYVFEFIVIHKDWYTYVLILILLFLIIMLFFLGKMTFRLLGIYKKQLV